MSSSAPEDLSSKTSKNAQQTNAQWGFFDIIVFAADILYLLGFAAGFVVGVWAVRAQIKVPDSQCSPVDETTDPPTKACMNRIDELLIWYVGVGGGAAMAIASVITASVYLYGVYIQKQVQIPLFEQQAILINKINTVLDLHPEVLVSVGLDSSFQCTKPVDDYDVSMSWGTLIMLTVASGGVFGGAILVAAGHPFYGLTLMFLSSILLKFTATHFHATIMAITNLIGQDNLALTSVAGILKISLKKDKSDTTDRTVLDKTKEPTYAALADAMMANKHAHAREQAKADLAKTQGDTAI